MKVVFHERFYEEYTADLAAARGWMESVVAALAGTHDFVEPEPATEEDLARVHGQAHIRQIRKDRPLYDIARLAARSGRQKSRSRASPLSVSSDRRGITPARILAGASAISTTWLSPSRS